MHSNSNGLCAVALDGISGVQTHGYSEPSHRVHQNTFNSVFANNVQALAKRTVTPYLGVVAVPRGHAMTVEEILDYLKEQLEASRALQLGFTIEEASYVAGKETCLQGIIDFIEEKMQASSEIPMPSPSDILNYLRSEGWEETESNDRRTIMAHSTDCRVFVPAEMLNDYAELVTLLTATVAMIEKRTVTEVLRAMQSPNGHKRKE